MHRDKSNNWHPWRAEKTYLDKSYIQSQSHSNTSVYHKLPLSRDDNSMIEPSHVRSLLSGKELTRLRAMAIRRGTWHRRLNATERALFSLTIRIVKEIRSNVLSRSLASIIEKLQVKTKNGLTAAFDTFGQPLAERISRIACRWGNTSAAKWSADNSFAHFLTIMHINNPCFFTDESASP